MFALEFVLEFFVEAKGLLPAFEFVAGLLNFFFVGPEIKEHIGVRHNGSLRCGTAGSQGAESVRGRLGLENGGHIAWATSAVLAYPTSERTGTVIASSQKRKRIVAAWVCLCAAVALYAPLAGATWAAHAMSCCTGDFCPIAQHHHPKKQASPQSEMDCGHDMGGMMNCSMSCCESSEKPLVTAVAFVLPDLVLVAAPTLVVSVAEDAHALAILPAVEPLSPPPRLPQPS